MPSTAAAAAVGNAAPPAPASVPWKTIVPVSLRAALVLACRGAFDSAQARARVAMDAVRAELGRQGAGQAAKGSVVPLVVPTPAPAAGGPALAGGQQGLGGSDTGTKIAAVPFPDNTHTPVRGHPRASLHPMFPPPMSCLLVLGAALAMPCLRPQQPHPCH